MNSGQDVEMNGGEVMGMDDVKMDVVDDDEEMDEKISDEDFAVMLSKELDVLLVQEISTSELIKKAFNCRVDEELKRAAGIGWLKANRELRPQPWNSVLTGLNTALTDMIREKFDSKVSIANPHENDAASCTNDQLAVPPSFLGGVMVPSHAPHGRRAHSGTPSRRVRQQSAGSLHKFVRGREQLPRCINLYG